MSNVLEQMLEASKEQLELEFEHKKELAQIKSCQNNEIKELKQKYKKIIMNHSHTQLKKIQRMIKNHLQ